MEKLEDEKEQLWPFLLTQKRLQLYQVQQIAGIVALPTSASGSDLLVMVCGKLHDNKHDPCSDQVVATKTVREEKNCHCKIWMLITI